MFALCTDLHRSAQICTVQVANICRPCFGSVPHCHDCIVSRCSKTQRFSSLHRVNVSRRQLREHLDPCSLAPQKVSLAPEVEKIVRHTVACVCVCDVLEYEAMLQSYTLIQYTIFATSVLQDSFKLPMPWRTLRWLQNVRS